MSADLYTRRPAPAGQQGPGYGLSQVFKGLRMALALGVTALALLLSCPPGQAARNATRPADQTAPPADEAMPDGVAGGAHPILRKLGQAAEQLYNSLLPATTRLAPPPWSLSPEARRLYYYLLLADGLREDSPQVIKSALNGLLALDPSLPVFQDGVAILLSREEFGEAENIARQGLQRFPGDSTLTLLLAGAYSENERKTEASALLEEYLKSYPGRREVSEELVRLYLKDGREKEAAELLASMPEADPSPESALFRAKVLSSLGRSSEALKILVRLVEKEPGSSEAWIELGLLHQRDKRLDESAMALGRAAEIAPDAPEVWLRLALLQIERGLLPEALRALDNISSPDQLVRAALRFADGRHFREAESTLDRAARNGANPDEIALFLSVIKQETGDDPLAGLEPLESIPPSSSLYPNALQQKSRIYLQAGQYDKARDMAADGRTRFPEVKELWGIEAYALVRMDKKDEAETLLKKALERFAQDEELLFTLGTVQDETGRKDEAVKSMEAILAVNPKNHQALNYIGYTLAEKNTDLQRALSMISSALEQNPDADYIVDSLAWVHYRLGNLDEAWAAITRCISLGGDDPTIWEHYGDIARAMGKREEAVRGYMEAITRNPANSADVRKKLSDAQKK